MAHARRSPNVEGQMIELTPAQAQALAAIAGREGRVSLHQVPHAHSRDEREALYVTVHGLTRGFRVGTDGRVTTIQDLLPGP
jgi:hypothetical protein